MRQSVVLLLASQWLYWCVHNVFCITESDSDDSGDSGGLSGGAIAGIVIGCIIGLILVVLAIGTAALFHKKFGATGKYSPPATAA